MRMEGIGALGLHRLDGVPRQLGLGQSISPFLHSPGCFFHRYIVAISMSGF